MCPEVRSPRSSAKQPGKSECIWLLHFSIDIIYVLFQREQPYKIVFDSCISILISLSVCFLFSASAALTLPTTRVPVRILNA